MGRRITDVSNLMEAIENKMISIDSVECKTKMDKKIAVKADGECRSK